MWAFDGIFATSRHIPGVKFAGLIHPGLIGTAPSRELLDIWNAREAALVEAGPGGTTLGGVLHTRPLGAADRLAGWLAGCWPGGCVVSSLGVSAGSGGFLAIQGFHAPPRCLRPPPCMPPL